MEKLNFSQYRRAKKISKGTMAEKLGIHVNTYSSWEEDPTKISLGNAIKICKILDADIDILFFCPDIKQKCGNEG